MEKEQLINILENYKVFLSAEGFVSRRYEVLTIPANALIAWNIRLDHVLWMIEQIPTFITESMISAGNKMEKAMRWLGFIQGVLWSHGLYSIDELRFHNR